MPTTLPDFDPNPHGLDKRWIRPDWPLRFPWWGAPASVRILVYADGPIHLDGGSFGGLTHVRRLLQAHVYPFVDFRVDFAHRDGGDPSATLPGALKLTDLDILNQFDEIFFFGVESDGDLDPDEHDLLNAFMAYPKLGGVLVTGDHADLGKRLAGRIMRAGKMRRYPAPEAAAPGWNTTIVEGPDANATYDHEDQSDDLPQTIRCRRYPLGSGPLPGRFRPHPVLCGPDGVITVLPDHQHEGEAVAPPVVAGDPEWPTKNGHQPLPEVIAWGRLSDPCATRHGQEIGVLSAYDGHSVDVGRILADSTWHHWLDLNLLGSPTLDPAYRGFESSESGRAALRQIEAFFLNVAIWLAPPKRQVEMRRFAWWSILWTDRVAELPRTAPITFVGEQALGALGRLATPCTAAGWIWTPPLFKPKIPHWEWPMLRDRLVLIQLPFETYLAGGILSRLSQAFGPWSGAAFPKAAPDPAALDREFQAGAQQGLDALGASLKGELTVVRRWLDSGYSAAKALG